MLKKINRSLSRRDFEVSRNEGQMYQTPLFGLVVTEKSEGKSQVGFIISKKISKKAVVRNKLRRLLTSAVQGNFSLLEKRLGNYIFLAKTSILKATNVEIESEVGNVLQKIK